MAAGSVLSRTVDGLGSSMQRLMQQSMPTGGWIEITHMQQEPQRVTMRAAVLPVKPCVSA